MTKEEQESAKLRSLLAACGEEIFLEVDLTAVQVPTRRTMTNEDDYVSTIGFRGDRIVGNLSMRLPAALLEVSHPMRRRRNTAPETADLEDWARELVNRLLGRWKNRCVAEGLDFMGGLPSVVRGRQIEFVHLRDVSEQALAFTCAELPMDVELGFKTDPVLPLFAPSQMNTAVLNEGNFVVFASESPMEEASK